MSIFPAIQGLIDEPDLLPGETIMEHIPANHSQVVLRSAGGRLTLTTKRLLFNPNRLDRLMDGVSWSIEREKIRRIYIEPPKMSLSSLFNGALRSRLAVESVEGKSDYFVVSKPKIVQERLQKAVCGNSLSS